MILNFIHWYTLMQKEMSLIYFTHYHLCSLLTSLEAFKPRVMFESFCEIKNLSYPFPMVWFPIFSSHVVGYFSMIFWDIEPSVTFVGDGSILFIWSIIFATNLFLCLVVSGDPFSRHLLRSWGKWRLHNSMLDLVSVIWDGDSSSTDRDDGDGDGDNDELEVVS